MRLRLASVLLLVALAAGCSKKPPVTTDKVDEVATPKKPEAAKEAASDSTKDDDANRATATVDDKIAKMCDLPEARFDFNSSSIGGDARRVIDVIARCFLEGPGKGKNLNVVGHADPRGEEEYNFALGQRRAGSVATLLRKAGLGEDRVSTTSRGELDATGTDDAGWARDRRVEIQLAP
jgi:peptidoglycan-associated lipoprotein